MWGQPQYNPASRFLDEIPGRLVDWRRLAPATGGWGTTERVRREASWKNTVGYVPGAKRDAGPRVTALSPGDRVLHTSFGLGTVLETAGAGDQLKATVDFGSAGTKRLSVKHAPMEKL